MQILSEKLRRIVAEELMAENLEAVDVLPSMSHLVPEIPPPEPGSTEEAMDLYNVIDQYHNRVIPEELQKDCDENIIGLFERVLLSKGITINTSYYDKVISSIKPTIKELKQYYGRERPPVTAAEHGIEFPSDELDTANSPSYPSGHTIQAHVVAGLLSDLHPELSEEITATADIISVSRIDRGVHFPTDIVYGKLIAEILTEEILNSLDERKPEGLS
jgi:hypothetical protein